jgi:aminoglycoside 6'-N-acetyltransferase
LQYYQLTETQKLELTLSPNIQTYGLDLFIGTLQCLNQGIGTVIMMAVLEYLMDNGVKKVVLDPQVDNDRAIRCYEKCGFKKQRILPHYQNHNGVYLECWLMEKDLSGIMSGGHVL